MEYNYTLTDYLIELFVVMLPVILSTLFCWVTGEFKKDKYTIIGSLMKLRN